MDFEGLSPSFACSSEHSVINDEKNTRIVILVWNISEKSWFFKIE